MHDKICICERAIKVDFFIVDSVQGTTGVSINFYKGSKISDSMFIVRISEVSLNVSQIFIEDIEL